MVPSVADLAGAGDSAERKSGPEEIAPQWAEEAIAGRSFDRGRVRL
jgi:hypothetical protein